MKTIQLPAHGIVINVNRKSGNIHSSELEDKNASPEYKAAIVALLNLVLAHACAGVDVEAPAYIEGIEVAVDSIANEFGD